MNTELFIWDFDGTVADTKAAIMGSAAAAIAALGRSVDLRSAGATIGLPLEELFRHAVLGADDDLVAQLVVAYREDFEIHGVGRSRLFPGIPELLDDLCADGHPCALATSRSRRSLDPLLEALGLRSGFDPVLTNDDVEHPKPHPEMVLAACGAHGIEPGEALVIGDTTYDMLMGHSAGALTCAVTWGNHTAADLAGCDPDHFAHSVVGLRALLTGLRGSSSAEIP